MSEELDQAPVPWQMPAPGSRDEELHERFASALRAVVSLPELTMRQAWISERLEALEAPDAVFWLDQLIRGAVWGVSSHLDTYMAAARWLVEVGLQDRYSVLQRLFEAAHEEGRETVKFLLREVPPQRELGEGAKLPEVRLPLERNVTLGERRQLALGSSRRLLERLVADPHPMVIERVLMNPLLRPQDVLMIASRRPTTVELLVTVAHHAGWYKVHEVREALVRNPYNHTSIALRLLPTLHIHTLRRIRDATDVHRAVVQMAELLVELREQRTAPLRV